MYYLIIKNPINTFQTFTTLVCIGYFSNKKTITAGTL